MNSINATFVIYEIKQLDQVKEGGKGTTKR
jgi:hypothetical protein